jgi:nucleoside-diphosphate-sugar epimerase
MTTVLITGANGFIGRALGSRCRATGIRTLGVAHPFTELPDYDEVYPGKLTAPLEGIFGRERIDAVVHGANHLGRDEYAVNTEGTRLWAEQALSKGIENQILLSSLSARENSVSPYGRAKYELEGWFRQKRFLSFRLGLVTGMGGLFGRLVDLVRRWPVLPMPEGGRTWVYPTSLDSLCRLLIRAAEGRVERPESGLFRFYQPDPVLIRNLVKEIARQIGTPCLIMNMPLGLLLAGLRAAERIPLLKIGVSSTNLLGLRQNNRNDFPSDFPRFGFPVESLEDLVRRALAGSRNHPLTASL